MKLRNLHIVILILPLLAATRVWAGTIPVCADCQAGTIQQGIALAEDRDTLLIKEGL